MCALCIPDLLYPSANWISLHYPSTSLWTSLTPPFYPCTHVVLKLYQSVYYVTQSFCKNRQLKFLFCLVPCYFLNLYICGAGTAVGGSYVCVCVCVFLRVCAHMHILASHVKGAKR
jgi:hypothetical protein